MTYTLQQIQYYIEKTIESFDRDIYWAKEKAQFSDNTPRRRFQYAMDSIERDHDNARGALSFVTFYLNEIEPEDYEKLNDLLFDGYFKAKAKAEKEILSL